MLIECESRTVRLGISVLSILISMVGIVFVEHSSLQLKQDQWIMNHICLLQIFASVLLFVGSLKGDGRLFVPWLFIASIFAYTLIYKSLDYLLGRRDETLFSWKILSLLYIISAFWFYFIHAVYQDFQEACHKTATAAYNNLASSKS